MSQCYLLLVTGYIRSVEDAIHNQIVPASIRDLCGLYYRARNLLCYMDDESLNGVDLNDEYKHKYNVSTIISYGFTGFCAKANCRMSGGAPLKCQNQLFDVLFQCGEEFKNVCYRYWKGIYG